MLTIITYHYVRDPNCSPYANLKTCLVSTFLKQLDFISTNYEVVKAEDVLSALTGVLTLPENACWLTFDDGYTDHYHTVAPCLEERGWQGSFFIPVTSALNRKLLDVNKIHLILSEAESSKCILRDVKEFLDVTLDQTFLQSCNILKTKRNSIESSTRRWSESDETLYLKRILQKATPLNVRKELIDQLFSKHVTDDPDEAVDNLYMNEKEIKNLVSRGMYIGGHSSSHSWSSTLSPAEQELEVSDTVKFLSSIGVDTDAWINCYPYGDWNDSLLRVLKTHKCLIGLTNIKGSVDIKTDNPLLMNRFDTNDVELIEATSTTK